MGNWGDDNKMLEVSGMEITARGIYLDNVINIEEIREDLRAILEASPPKATQVRRILE